MIALLAALAHVMPALGGEPAPRPPPYGEPPRGGGVLRADLFGPDGIFRAALVGDGGSRPRDPNARSLVTRIVGECQDGPACDASVLLGDNFYALGVFGLLFPDGPMMRRRFHARYAPLVLPFYAVLGNHEYLSPAPLASVRHTARHPDEVNVVGDTLRVTPEGPTWVASWRYWAVRDGDDLELLFLDTLPLVGAAPRTLADVRDRQLAWLRDHCANDPAPRRRIAFGHHPAVTFGKYRDTPGELLSAETMEVLLACGVRDYASGHDHHLQRIDLVTGSGDVFHQVVSGKGGQVRSPYPFADEATRVRGVPKEWAGESWVPTLALDHTGDATDAYAGWADLRVTRGGEVSVTLDRIEAAE